ncbi:MAG TPA: hypothetical protein PKV36_26000 [Leptospiraceae bacterium]|nr:hypothetical protein [Leptospiraceae bacterium]
MEFISLFGKLSQVQCLHYCHETCRKEQVCAPSVQSQDLLVIRLARRHDFKIQKMLPHFRILKPRRLLLTLGDMPARILKNIAVFKKNNGA